MEIKEYFNGLRKQINFYKIPAADIFKSERWHFSKIVEFFNESYKRSVFANNN